MGRGGNGLLVGDNLLELRGITAFAYGPTHLLIAFDDLRLEIYSLQLKLIKVQIQSFRSSRISQPKESATSKCYPYPKDTRV